MEVLIMSDYTNLPIDVELLNKRRLIPVKLAELSYINPEATIRLLRIWGEKKMPITPLFNEIMSYFEN
jgi:hypothetical protein